MSGSLSKARSLPFSGKFFSVSESMSISLINVDHAAGQVRTEGKKSNLDNQIPLGYSDGCCLCKRVLQE
jgi:hypothetical protein